nr:putative prefoldin subunit 2 [Quercus suber]
MSQQQQMVSAKKQQDLQVQYSNYKDTLQAIASKIGDVEQEAEEHKLVLETLTPLPGDRKCFRMINGVLVERTVSDVLPALQTNADGLKQVLEDLVKQYRTKQDDMEKWKVRQTFGFMCGQRRLLTAIAEEEQCASRSAMMRLIEARVPRLARSAGLVVLLCSDYVHCCVWALATLSLVVSVAWSMRHESR